MLPANASSEEFAARCHHLVAIAAFHSLGQKSCLPAAMVLIRLLARHGLNAQLMIGVKPHASTIQAHAWVEFAGRVLGESVADFQPLHSIRAVRYT